jgi:hypothetical protein
MGTRINYVYYALRDKLDQWWQAHGVTPSLRPYGLRYPALPVPLNASWTFALSVEEYVDNYWDGVYSLEYVLEQETERCSAEKIVLAGYSSGALAIHLALGDLATSAIMSHIGAVALLADPAKRGDGAEFVTGSANPAANGIYMRLHGASDTPQIPGSQVGHTISHCRNGDFVCAPGLGVKWSVHGEYSVAETNPLGTWAGERVIHQLE